jgi:hypothetical protein
LLDEIYLLVFVKLPSGDENIEKTRNGIDGVQENVQPSREIALH